MRVHALCLVITLCGLIVVPASLAAASSGDRASFQHMMCAMLCGVTSGPTETAQSVEADIEMRLERRSDGTGSHEPPGGTSGNPPPAAEPFCAEARDFGTGPHEDPGSSGHDDPPPAPEPSCGTTAAEPDGDRGMGVREIVCRALCS